MIDDIEQAKKDRAWLETFETCPTADPSTPHSELKFKFRIEGKKFEAVGFLREEEKLIPAAEAFRRTDNGRLVRSNADWEFVWKHRGELPFSLEFYELQTSHRDVEDPASLTSLAWDLYGSRGGGWMDYLLVDADERDLLDKRVLILRRAE